MWTESVYQASNPQLQAPNPNHSQTAKSQFNLQLPSPNPSLPALGFGTWHIWDLGFGSGWSLGFGAWDLTRIYLTGFRRSAFAMRLASRLPLSVSIGSGSASRQFGHSSLVAGMFGRSSTAIASSSVAVRICDGAFASDSWTRATTSVVGVRGGGAGHAPHPRLDLARAGLVRRQPELALHLEVAVGPEPGHGRQIVRGDRGERLRRIPGGRGLLEPEQPVRQDVAGGELRARVSSSTVPRSSPTITAFARWLSSATIASRSPGMAVHVRAVPRLHARRDPEQPEQPHHVIDAQAAGVPEAGADRLDERLVAGGAEPVRHERRQAPVLPARVELVWRRADADALARARPGTPRRRRRRRRTRSADPASPASPPTRAPAADRPGTAATGGTGSARARPAGGGARRLPGDDGCRRSAGQLTPAGAELLGQRAERRELLEAGPARAGTSRTPASVRAADGAPHRLERAAIFSSKIAVAIDQPLAVQAPGRARQLADAAGGLRARQLPRCAGRAGCGTGGSTGSTGWPAAAASAPAAASGLISAMPACCSRAQRPSQRRSREVADAPAASRARGIELNRPAPGARARRRDGRRRARRSAVAG